MIEDNHKAEHCQEDQDPFYFLMNLNFEEVDNIAETDLHKLTFQNIFSF